MIGSRGKLESENSLAEMAKNGVLEVKPAYGTGEARLEKPLLCFVKLMISAWNSEWMTINPKA